MRRVFFMPPPENVWRPRKSCLTRSCENNNGIWFSIWKWWERIRCFKQATAISRSKYFDYSQVANQIVVNARFLNWPFNIFSAQLSRIKIREVLGCKNSSMSIGWNYSCTTAVKKLTESNKNNFVLSTKSSSVVKRVAKALLKHEYVRKR